MNAPPVRSITQVLALHAWLDRAVAERPPIAALQGTVLPDSDSQLVWQWWHQQSTRDLSRSSLAGFAALSLCLVGILVGSSVTSIALTYTGSHPVNLFVLLGVVVGIPLLTLALTALVRVTQVLLGKSSQSILALAAMQLRRVDPDRADYLEQHAWRYGNVLYWSTQRTRQWFSLGFFIAALVTFLLIITFSDIAFGWSSTLDVAPQTVFSVTEVLSWPWQSWLPLARPDLAFIEASRFFRMATHSNPELLGHWWPFVALCIGVWGLLPRLGFWLWCRYRAQQGLKQALLNHPEVTALISQLRGTAIAYPSNAQQGDPASTEQVIPVDHETIETQPTISWNDATDAEWQVRYGDADSELADLFVALTKQNSPLTIAVKGWEPPLLAFNDFVAKLRQHIGTDLPIRIQALPLPSRALNDAELQAWRATLAKLHDPRVYLGQPS